MSDGTAVDGGMILGAARLLEGRVHRTPMQGSETLGRLAGVELALKLELFQKTGSFKPRGALNRMAHFTREEKARGVVTVSAGNHAQAVAWAARSEGLPCTVVMPANASASKIRATRGYGAEIVLHDELATIFERLEELRRERGQVFLPPFDDPLVVAGAATVGLEIHQDLPRARSVVVGVGGGGLIAGVASAMRAFSPATRVFGIEPAGAPTMTRALEAGRPVRLERIETIADGLSPPFAGALNVWIVSDSVEEVALVSDGEIIEAMRLLAERCKLFVEPSGAAALAGVLAGRLRALQPPVAVIVSGGNIDTERFKTLV